MTADPSVGVHAEAPAGGAPIAEGAAARGAPGGRS